MGQWVPGAEGIGDLGYLGVDFDTSGLGVVSPGGEMWEESFGSINLLAEGFHTDPGGVLGEDALLHDWDLVVNPTELEVPQEAAAVLAGPLSTFTIPLSSPTSNNMTSSTSLGTPSSDEQTNSSSKDTSSGEEWLCDFTKCGRSFSQRHKLKYVPAYSLVLRNITANQ